MAVRNAGIGIGTGLTWPLANMAVFIPLLLPFDYPVARMFWVNGGGTAGGNIDVGLYTPAGARIYSSGSTAQSGSVPGVQYVPANVLLGAGLYYLAMAMDNVSTNRAYGSSISVTLARPAGLLQMASAFPLPASATFATVANPFYPVMGITRTASGF